MGNFLGGDENAKNEASETANIGANISSDISLDSTIVCGNINEIDIQKGCNIIDSQITQDGTCTLNNDSTQNTTINNSIKQTSKQSLSQTAKAVGQNFSLNFGNVNASNIGSESIVTQGNISNKINSSCTADALNKNLVNCEGGNLVHSQIDQTTAANINQECVQKNALTNTLSQDIEQIITQKATAIKKDAITAILLATAALILSVGVASKLGAGKLIRYVLIFFCVLSIITIVAMFSWNIISSKDFNPPHGIQKKNTAGDYCPDVSIYSQFKPRHFDSPGANVGYYHDALHCTASGGTWLDYEGKSTVGYSTTPWTGKGPAPDDGTHNWNPPLDPAETTAIGPLFPQCLTSSTDPEGDSFNQCWAINSGIDGDLLHDAYVRPISPAVLTTEPLPFLTSSPGSYVWKKNNDFWKKIDSSQSRDYSFWRDKCLANKCMWTPDIFGLENKSGTGIKDSVLMEDPITKELSLDLSQLIVDLPAYSYAMTVDNTRLDTQAHKDLAPVQNRWPTDVGEFINSGVTDEVINEQILPIVRRYKPTLSLLQLKAMYPKDISTPTQPQYISMTDILNPGFQAYTRFPFCTGGRSLKEGKDETVVVAKRYSCDKETVVKQRQDLADKKK